MADNNTKVCDTGDGKVTLIFACSGAADVGHLSDLAARQLTKDGHGQMFCMAGLGGRVEPILKKTASADCLFVIDGCPLDCARKSVEEAGFNDYTHLQVTALGLKKGESPATPENVNQVIQASVSLMSE